MGVSPVRRPGKGNQDSGEIMCSMALASMVLMIIMGIADNKREVVRSPAAPARSHTTSAEAQGQILSCA